MVRALLILALVAQPQGVEADAPSALVSILESPVELEQNKDLHPQCVPTGESDVSLAVGEITIANSSGQQAELEISALLDGVSVTAYAITLTEGEDDAQESCTLVGQPQIGPNAVLPLVVAVEVDAEQTLALQGTLSIVATLAAPTGDPDVELTHAPLVVAEPGVSTKNPWEAVFGVPFVLSVILLLLMWGWLRGWFWFPGVAERPPLSGKMRLGDRLDARPDFTKAPGFDFAVLAAAFTTVLSLTALKDVPRLSSTLLAAASASFGVLAAFSRLFYYASSFYGTGPEGKKHWPKGDSDEGPFAKSPPGRIWGWFVHIWLLTFAILGLLTLLGMIAVFAWDDGRRGAALVAVGILGLVVLFYAFGVARDVIKRPAAEAPAPGVDLQLNAKAAIAAAAEKYAENRDWQSALEQAARTLRDERPS